MANFISNAFASIANRAPALAEAAVNNPVTAVIVTSGTVGLAAWKGSEVALKSGPYMKSFKNKVHNWSAPDAVKQAAQAAAEKIQAAADMAQAQAAAAEAAAKVHAAAAEAAPSVIIPPAINATNGKAA